MSDYNNKDLIHIKNGDFECLKFRILEKYSDKITHMITLRHGGASNGVYSSLNIRTVGKDNIKKNEVIADLQTKLSKVQSSCSGIKSDLDKIFGLTVATTVSSSVGTALAGGALAVGIVKSKTDKKIEDLESLSDVEFYKYVSTKANYDNEAELNKLTKKSKTFGNVRTGLMAGATVTSAVSTGTSIGASVSAKKLAEKMEECDKAVYELKNTISIAEAEEVEAEKLEPAKAITKACSGFDKDNINTLKRMTTASAIVSGIGTATAGAGTVTSIMANTDKVRSDNSEKGKKKEKGLNLASNILAGVTTGTSGASTILSAAAISKAKKDSKVAEECENAL